MAEVVARLATHLLSKLELLQVLLDNEAELVNALDHLVKLNQVTCFVWLLALAETEATVVGMATTDHQFALEIRHELEQAILGAEFLFVNALQLKYQLLVGF